MTVKKLDIGCFFYEYIDRQKVPVKVIVQIGGVFSI